MSIGQNQCYQHFLVDFEEGNKLSSILIPYIGQSKN